MTTTSIKVNGNDLKLTRTSEDICLGVYMGKLTWRKAYIADDGTTWAKVDGHYIEVGGKRMEDPEIIDNGSSFNPLAGI